MDLKATLREQFLSWGGDFFGVADLSPYQEEIQDLYGDAFCGLERAVSIGVRLPNMVVDEVLEHPSHTYLAYYDIANALLNQIALKTNNVLEKLSYRAYPVPASQRVGAEREGGIFSHRMAAALAGIGWIGKSCALVTQEVGPRLRLVTVLTDAPLEKDTPIENLCGTCEVCTKACPAHAILGKNFTMGDALSLRFDFHKCDAYLSEVRQTFGKRICGRCIAVCPRGRK